MLNLFLFEWAILSNLIKEDWVTVSHFCTFVKNYRNPGKSTSDIKCLGFGTPAIVNATMCEAMKNRESTLYSSSASYTGCSIFNQVYRTLFVSVCL